MIQYKQSKKIKGARKKAREELIERLQLKHPLWFEGKSEKEIINLVNAFKAANIDDDSFPSFCISYEARLGRGLNNNIK